MNIKQTITGVICGTGACVPKRVMDNYEIAEFVDTSDQWIRERTGVIRRHIAEKETTVSMAAEAGRQAMEGAGVSPEEIDLILLATASPDQIFPCTACSVQEKLGALNATGFDLNAACSGFLFAYNTAQAYISSGIFRTVLVIGAESLSRLVDWKDRNTCILFGDGAGAVLLKAKNSTFYLPATHSEGSGGMALTCNGTADIHPFNKDAEPEKNLSYIHMNGKEVFQFAIRKVPQVIEEVLQKNNLTKEEILNTEELSLELLKLLKSRYSGTINERYDADEALGEVELLGEIAKRRGCLMKGGEPDLTKAAAILLEDFRSGKLGKITLELPEQAQED